MTFFNAVFCERLAFWKRHKGGRFSFWLHFEKVMSLKVRRGSIVNLRFQGRRPSEMVYLLNEPWSAVYATINRYRQYSSTEDRPLSGRPRSARTTTNRKAIRCRLQSKKQWPCRGLADAYRISRESVRNILNKDLNFKPYKLREVQLLTDDMKAARLRRSRALFRKFMVVSRFLTRSHPTPNERTITKKLQNTGSQTPCSKRNSRTNAEAQVCYGLGWYYGEWQNSPCFPWKWYQD